MFQEPSNSRQMAVQSIKDPSSQYFSDTAEFITDNYNHEDPSIIYTETNLPGAGWQSDLADVSLSVKCDCVSGCGQNCACVKYSGGSVNYVNNLLNFEKIIANPFVLECNGLCRCAEDCGNRLVQFGPREDLVVVRTDKKGYGLKTEKSMERGSFVCEYAGELIGKEEARKRAQFDGKNYIFVLKEHFFNSVQETIVDPTCIGNIGRYINHSCAPNCAIVPVRVSSPIPRLAVFALCNIGAGEEITYDYSSGGVGLGTSPCFCGTIACRGFLPFDEDLLK